MEKSIKLNKEELDLLYTQLSARKQYFEEDMLFWAEKKDVKEVERCSKAITRIQDLMTKLLNS